MIYTVDTSDFVIIILFFLALIVLKAESTYGSKFSNNDRLYLWILFAINAYFFYHIMNVYYYGYSLYSLYGSLFYFFGYVSIKTILQLLVSILIFSVIFLFVFLIIDIHYLKRNEDKKTIEELEKKVADLKEELNDRILDGKTDSLFRFPLEEEIDKNFRFPLEEKIKLPDSDKDIER